MADESEHQLLYEGDVPVTLRLSERESRREMLTIKISNGINKAQHNQRFLSVQVTSEADPFLLYLFDVTEEDFQGLKTEQSLLVDFTRFPDKVIELMEECIQAGREGSARMAAQLSSRAGSSQLAIIETNHFRQICHLSLAVRAGNDAAVKKYLAQRVQSFKAKLESVQRSYAECQRALSDKSTALDGTSLEVRELREATQRQAADLKAQHSMALADVKERMMASQRELQTMLEQERKEALAAAAAENQGLQSQVAELSGRLREAEADRQRLQGEVRDHLSALRTKTEELEGSRADQARLRDEWRELNRAKFDVEKGLGEAGLRIAGLEQRLAAKDEMLSREHALYEAVLAQKSTLEDALAAVRASYQKAQEQLQASCGEIAKGNEIIERLQTELKASKSKLKLRNAMAAQADQVIKERQAAIEQHLREISTLKESLALQTGSAESLRRQLDQANSKVAESEKLLQSNQQVIQWLNNQINESQLAKSPAAFAPGHSSFSFRPSVGLPPHGPPAATTFGGSGLAGTPAAATTPLHKSPAYSTPLTTVTYRGAGAPAAGRDAAGKDSFLKYLSPTPPGSTLLAS